MTDDSSKQKPRNIFAHLKFDKAKGLAERIEKGDRISGDDLLIALREHEDGPLPETFVKYLEKPLSGWEEKKPGPKPKGSLFRSSERIFLNQYYEGFKAVLNGEADGMIILPEFVEKHLPDIDESFSVSEKASQLVAMYVYKDVRKAPGIMNKISSPK